MSIFSCAAQFSRAFFLFLFFTGLTGFIWSQTCSWDYVGAQGVSSGTGEWTDLEYHPISGELYLAFQDESLGERITVMRFDGSTWNLVGAAGFSEGQSFHPDLEFDSAGTPYVAYRHFPAFGYSVQMFDGTSWGTVGSSDFTGDANGNGSLAVDPVSGDLYLAYPDLNNGLSNKLSVQRWNGTSWSLVGTQGFTSDGTGTPDIQVDSFGVPHVLYTSTSTYSLNLVAFDGSNWNAVGTTNFSNNNPSSYSYGAALQFHPLTGNPTVLTRVIGNVLDVYTFNGTAWIDDTLPNYANSSSNQRFGFRFDADGNMYVALKRLAGTPVFAASVVSNKGGAWDYVGDNTISENLADYVALALNAQGEPTIAFHDNSTGGAGAVSVMKASCEIEGCMDPTACNYDEDATQDNGSCEYTSCLGCTNPLACNYDSDAILDDGSCLDILGCTDTGACNFNASANCDDGSCEFTSCLGCTDPLACEFDPSALIDDASCTTYEGDPCDDANTYTENDSIQADCGCQGIPIDTDGDGLSDEEEINEYGTDINLQDSDYDGLTDGLEVQLAGTNPQDPDSNDDGCGDAESFAGLCPGQNDCMADFNNDGYVNGVDLLNFLGVFGTSCNEE